MPNTTHKLFMNYSKPSATQLELKKRIWGKLVVSLCAPVHPEATIPRRLGSAFLLMFYGTKRSVILRVPGRREDL